jgi:membrane-associated protein
MSDFLSRLFHTFFPPTQEKLQGLVTDVGPHTFYLILFAIVFCETGLVVMPFLPGDSLLFAVGAVGAGENAPFSVPVAGAMLVLAALLGDNCNYWLGRRLGPAVFASESSRLLNKKHLLRTQAFYDRYGPKMVILARFVPIVRTFAPFVAGIGKMSYGRFLLFSVIGAVAWVGICMTAGYMLGSVPFVKKNFEVVLVAIIVISVLPMVVEFLRHKSAGKAKEEMPV